ncbi:MAG: hypothetical protein KF802_01505 [Bdellovibrionaceae bacterium]|nr:hypothetical protein [Pseudobdellovibrionaceae bacterium]MBX3034865.1 hypothetical protein [Pseudobdellovibrionaceae bacterium]
MSNAPVPAGNGDPALFRLDKERADMGKADSLRYNILSWVLDERYDRAIQELREFDQRPSEYPNFHGKVERYINHSIDLIYAIKAKRNFPGINSLTRAKQQELREKFKEHFKELQQILLKIEKVETDLRIEDVRSTIYVVRALWLAAIAIVCLAFVLEIFRGLAQTTGVVVDDGLNKVTEWLFSSLGL